MERHHFLSELVKQEFGSFAGEEWPEDAQLFEPHENEQSLMYEYADCLAVRCLLLMYKLPFTVQMRPNAEYMSPSGELPLLKAGKLCVASFKTINSFVERKGISLSDTLTDVEVADMQAAMSLIFTNLRNAEVVEIVSRTCEALSMKLGNKDYFCFDDRPTELDALVFGHLFTILTTTIPDGVDLPEVVKSHRNLLEFCQRIERQYFTARSHRRKH